MPPRNGRSRRQPSAAQSNDAENEHGGEEEVGEEAPRPQKVVTKTKKSNRKPRAEGDADNDVEQPAQSPPINIVNFINQPLSREDGIKINAIAGDWQKVANNVRTSAISLVKDVGEAMAEAGMGEDNGPALKELAQIEAAMHDLLKTRARLLAHQESLKGIYESIIEGDVIDNVVERYERGVALKIEEWDQKTSRQKYGKDDDYINFKQRIFEVQNPDTAMPPVTTFIPAEEGDESDEEDIQIGGMTQDYKCPLTLTTLVKPVTSQTCKHSFSRDAIREFFKSNTHQDARRCPASGCSQMVRLSDFKDDQELEKRVTAYERREKRREAEADSGNEDAEEIID